MGGKVDINKPFMQAGQALQLLFHLVHGLFRQLYASLIARGHQVDLRMLALPSHRPRIGDHRLGRVEKRPILMVFQNAPTAFNGVVLAVVRQVIGQADVQAIVADKVAHALHVLGATAIVFRAIVKIDHQGAHSAKALTNRFPHCVRQSARQSLVTVERTLYTKSSAKVGTRIPTGVTQASGWKW